jgi:uncharacterized protein (DUF2252 family)
VSDLVPHRFGGMASSLLAYFQGAAVVTAADLAATPSNGVYVQASGDARLTGFGVFPARTRTLVCDMIDFNETQPAPWEWDVKRLAASVVVAARHVGLDEAKARDAATAVVRHYRGTIAALSTETSVGIWAGHLRVDDLVAALDDHARPKGTRKGRRSSTEEPPSGAVVPPATHAVESGGRAALGRRPPGVRDLDEAETSHLRRLFEEYRRTLPTDGRHLLSNYHLVDIAGFATTVDTLGEEAAILLLEGRGDPDHLFLQMRRARPSILAPYAGGTSHMGDSQRVVEGQRLVQALADPFLGRPHGDDDWFVRSLREPRVSLDPQAKPEWFASAARVCGATLARAHARSVDPAVISGYLGGSDRFDEAIATFAEEYADQTEKDFDAFRAAIRRGRLAVASRD